MAPEITEPDHAAAMSRPVTDIGRVVALGALVVASIIAMIALAQGSDRDLWSLTSTESALAHTDGDQPETVGFAPALAEVARSAAAR